MLFWCLGLCFEFVTRYDECMAKDLDGVFVRKVWKRLRDSSVNVVDNERYKKADEIAVELSEQIESHVFLPTTIHGYLGIQKGGGVTRFLPILTADDMAVYYYLCYRLAPRLLTSRKGIFGAWHMKPEVSEDALDEEVAEGFGQAYGTNPFSSHWWLKNWQSYTDLIREVIADKSAGNFVVSTDVANFYDSIEIPRLISRARESAPDETKTVEALAAFLSSWNRKHMGYMPSTKGIPQEIVSDASRVLAHFYLQDFDDDFIEYCDANGLVFVRWSDDFLIFGTSKQKLEDAVHVASRMLRDLGLNLNAAKTKYMSKSDLASYRALDFLKAIADNDHTKVARELRKIKTKLSRREEFRLDTVFRAMIGYLAKTSKAKSTLNKAFVREVGDGNRDLLHSLNNTQMLRYIELSDDPIDTFKSLRDAICRARFGGPKASFLHMMRRYRSRLAVLGMTKKLALNAVDKIEASSKDSEIIGQFCGESVRAQYK